MKNENHYYAYDRLTGLVSGEYFYELAQEQIESHRGEETNIVYFNVDNFKLYNTEHGYEAGDQFLVDTSRCILEAFAGDIVGRTSNDHFIVLTRRADVKLRICQVHDRVRKLTQGLRMEIHAGIYTYEEGTSIRQSHDNAKTACDALRGDFSRIYGYYDQEVRRKQAMEKYIVDHIDYAISHQCLEVYYQPIIRVFSSKVCGAESLVRWNDETHGLMMPGSFIPILEKHRLIHKVDQYVIARVCEDQRRRLALGESILPISVNLSRLDFQLTDVFTMVDSIVKESGVPESLIRVEITESALSDNEERLHETMRCLKEAGYEIWLDDFGSEYSTLNTLQDFDFDLLKIDMKFFKTFQTKEKGRTIISAVTDLAKRLHMRVLAEGIETIEQYEFLKAIGCDKAQGYYFAKPMPLSVIEGLNEEIEGEAERKFYNEIGELNCLSPDPLRKDTDKDKDAFIAEVPNAIVLVQNERFSYLYVNEGFRSVLKTLSVDSVEQSEQEINDDIDKLKTRLIGLSTKCRKTQDVESLDFILRGKHVNIQSKEIAFSEGKQAVYVTLYNLSAMENVQRLSRLETSLNFLYSIYDRVDLFETDKDNIETIYLSSDYYKASIGGKRIAEGIAEYCQTDVAPEDKEAFLTFYDMSTVEERMRETKKNYLVQPIRTLGSQNNVSVQLYMLIRTSDGETVNYISCVRDIYSLKVNAYEDQLAKTKTRDSYWYHVISTELHISIIEWDPLLHEAYASSDAYHYVFSKDSLNDILHNKGSKEAVHPEDWEEAMRFYALSRSGARRAESELRLKMMDGSYRWSRVIGLFNYNEQGKQVHVTGLVMDIEEEKRSTEQAKFLNMMPMALGIFEVMHGKTRQLFMNDEYYRLMEDDREHRAIHGNSPFMANIHPDDKERVQLAMKQVIDGAETCSEKCRVLNGKGVYISLRFSSRVAKREENYILVYSSYILLEND